MTEEQEKPTYQTVEQLKGVPDGLIIVKNTKFKSKAYPNEKAVVDYLVKNINLFVSGFLKDELVEYAVDKPINKDNHQRHRLAPRGRRVDLYIKGKKAVYIIEVKNPRYPVENRQGIGQLLDYGREFLYPKKELLLISTMFDFETAKTIEFYKLPIRYVYMDEMRFLEYRGAEKT